MKMKVGKILSLNDNEDSQFINKIKTIRNLDDIQKIIYLGACKLYAKKFMNKEGINENPIHPIKIIDSNYFQSKSEKNTLPYISLRNEDIKITPKQSMTTETRLSCYKSCSPKKHSLKEKKIKSLVETNEEKYLAENIKVINRISESNKKKNKRLAKLYCKLDDKKRLLKLIGYTEVKIDKFDDIIKSRLEKKLNYLNNRSKKIDQGLKLRQTTEGFYKNHLSYF